MDMHTAYKETAGMAKIDLDAFKYDQSEEVIDTSKTVRIGIIGQPQNPINRMLERFNRWRSEALSENCGQGCGDGIPHASAS